MDKLDRRLIQLKIEREAVKKETDEASKKRMDLIAQEIAKLEREYADLDEVWQAEKANVAGTQHIKEEIDKVKLAMEDARAKVTGSGCPSCSTGSCRSSRHNSRRPTRKRRKRDRGRSCWRTQVGAEEIAEVVSRAYRHPRCPR